jgi:hypothetical protein
MTTIYTITTIHTANQQQLHSGEEKNLELLPGIKLDILEEIELIS